MARYFLQDTPLADFERMMTQIPRSEKSSDKGNRDPTQRRQLQRLKNIQTEVVNAGTDENTVPLPAG